MKPVFYSKDRNTQTKEEEAKKYIQSVQKYTKVKNKNYTTRSLHFWLLHGQLWAIIKGVASPT